MSVARSVCWWDIRRDDWAFTQPLGMEPLEERITAVMGAASKKPTAVVRNPQLQRLQALLGDDKLTGKSESSDPLLSRSQSKEVSTKRRGIPPRRAVDPATSMASPVDPPPATAVAPTQTTAPEGKVQEVPSTWQAPKSRQSVKMLSAPLEAAPSPPSSVPVQTAPIPIAVPTEATRSIAPSVVPEPVRAAIPSSPPKKIVAPKEVAPSAPVQTKVTVVDSVDKASTLKKLKQLDDLLEELELDFTEVMVSDQWDPIRSLVRDLTKSFS